MTSPRMSSSVVADLRGARRRAAGGSPRKRRTSPPSCPEPRTHWRSSAPRAASPDRSATRATSRGSRAARRAAPGRGRGGWARGARRPPARWTAAEAWTAPSPRGSPRVAPEREWPRPPRARGARGSPRWSDTTLPVDREVGVGREHRHHRSRILPLSSRLGDRRIGAGSVADDAVEGECGKHEQLGASVVQSWGAPRAARGALAGSMPVGREARSEGRDCFTMGAKKPREVEHAPSAHSLLDSKFVYSTLASWGMNGSALVMRSRPLTR